MFPCMYSGLFILCLFVCYVFAGSEWVGSFQLSIWDVGQEGALWPGKQPKTAGSFFFKICAEVWPQCCVFFHFCGSKKRSLQSTPGYARLFFLKDYSCVSELPVTADQYNTDLSRVKVALPV